MIFVLNKCYILASNTHAPPVIYMSLEFRNTIF